MKTPAIFIPEAFEDIFSADQQSQSLSQKQLQNEFMRPWWYYETFHFCQAGETIVFFFFSNMKITAKRQRTPNYVELHAWAILSPMRSLYGRKENLEQTKDINFLVK